GGSETRRHGPAPFEYGEHGGLLDAELPGHRSGGPAGDGDGDPWREPVRRLIREELDELGRTRSRWILRPGPKLRSSDRSTEAALREIHPGVCRKRKWCEGGGHRQDRARDRFRRQSLRLASVAGQRLRQSGRMAIGTRIDVAPCADRFGGNSRRTQSECVEQIRAASVQESAAAETLERTALPAGMAAVHA